MKKLFTERHGMHEPRVKDEGAAPRDLALRVEVRWRDAGGLHAELFSLKPGWHVVRIGG